jgi:hypothetical protein
MRKAQWIVSRSWRRMVKFRKMLLVVRGVAVEKLAHSEFAKIGSHQEALQTIFPSLLDIFYHPIFDFFQKDRLFQQPQDFSTLIPL